MKNKKINKLVIEGICEILISIKKMGIPFVVLGSLFLIYSRIEGRAVIPFREFMTVFLSMILFQIILENVWLEKELHELKKEVTRMKENYRNK